MELSHSLLTEKMTSVFYKLCFGVALLASTAKGQWDPNFATGRNTMVHLFEWRWTDIAQECERFLGPYGFGGIQVSPPNENAVITTPFRPWWERYQPVSYRLETRSGNETEFADMVRRCNAVGVRIYVDAVINHMTGNAVVGNGTGGSTFDSQGKNYPGVPYGPADFNDGTTCPTRSGSIEDYQNNDQVRNCELSGLRDLNQGKAAVRQKIVDYMDRLTRYGVAGFRIDASKHMWPSDINAIVTALANLSTAAGFPAGGRPFIYQEVIDLGNEPIKGSDYFQNGRVTEFKYGKYMGEVLRKMNYQKLAYIKNFGEGWAMYPTANSLIFIDNHDNQRGHGAGGASILTFRASRLYKMGTAFLLAWPYGVAQIMSSYVWDQNLDQAGKDANDWIGPPNVNGTTNAVTINPDGTCGNGWVCEHRWRQIYNMVRFRNAVAGTAVQNWWDNGNHQIAFSRGDKGFIAINNEDYPMFVTLSTGLPPGMYCDVISGNKSVLRCTGKTVTVMLGGKAFISIPNTDEDPMIAIHAGSKL